MATNDTNLMGWDDVLENDGQEFIVLPEGDYTYTVTNFERGHFPGGAKIDLLLYRTVEWKIAAFFRSIGQKKHGEKTVMNWNKVVGSRGKAHFKPREYQKDGQTRQVNDVDRFIDYDPSVAMTPVKTDDLPWGNGGF